MLMWQTRATEGVSAWTDDFNFDFAWYHSMLREILALILLPSIHDSLLFVIISL